jgi:LAS superfamily LD-carboxypeptidase LdcB
MSYPAVCEAATEPRPAIITSAVEPRGRPVRHLDPALLRWDAHPEYEPFMHEVYEAHVAAASRIRPFRASLADSELARIPGGQCLQRDAAPQARRLLSAAKLALRQARLEGNLAALEVESFYVSSGYRSANHQYRLWQERFPGFFAESQGHRAAMRGTSTGPQAARWLAHEIGHWLAAPGFSNHNAGRAIDLACRLSRGRRLTADHHSASIQRWHESWLYQWLTENAVTFSFCPYDAEPWHWEHNPGPGPCRPR